MLGRESQVVSNAGLEVSLNYLPEPRFVSFFGSTIIRISYGVSSSSPLESESSHDANYARSLIRDSDNLITQQALAFQPGRYLVGFLPWLKYVPAWFPGAGWKTRLESIGQVSDRVVSGPFEKVKDILVGCPCCISVDERLVLMDGLHYSGRGSKATLKLSWLHPTLPQS